MAAPTNTTALTATAIASLPASVTQSVHDAGTTYTVWYTFTAPTGAVVVSAWGFGDLTVYRPTLRPYVGPASAPVLWLAIDALNKPCQFPVTPGVPYYLEVTPNAGNPTPASLTLSVEIATDGAGQAGDILVIADAAGHPSALYAPTGDFALRQFAMLPWDSTASSAANLQDGTMLLVDEANTRLILYDATFTLIAPVTLPGPLARWRVAANRTLAQFYAVHGSVPASIVAIDPTDGTVTPKATIAGVTLDGLCPNNDGSVLLYTLGAFGTAVKQWNLTTDTALADLAAGVAGYRIYDLLALPDGSFLVAFWSLGSVVPQDYFVRRYSAAGALVQSYPFGTNYRNAAPRMVYGADHPNTFTVWAHELTTPVDGTHVVSRFLTVRVSDGAILSSTIAAEFDEDTGANDDGVYAYSATATPMARFGHANSCPFLVLPVPRGPDGGDEDRPPFVAPSYHLDARYIRRLRRAPHLAQENSRVFYRRFELDLERGVGLATGQGADPMVLLRISRDGGQTWGEEQRMSAGRLGEYTARVIARRLGQARDTVFEVVVSDPVAWSLVGAWLDLEAGTS